MFVIESKGRLFLFYIVFKLCNLNWQKNHDIKESVLTCSPFFYLTYEHLLTWPYPLECPMQTRPPAKTLSFSFSKAAKNTIYSRQLPLKSMFPSLNNYSYLVFFLFLDYLSYSILIFCLCVCTSKHLT